MPFRDTHPPPRPTKPRVRRENRPSIRVHLDISPNLGHRRGVHSTGLVHLNHVEQSPQPQVLPPR
eukprot:16444704-Heterocapsa_arctica.AAC.1